MKKIMILLSIVLIISGCEYKFNSDIVDETPTIPEIVDQENYSKFNKNRILVLENEMERLYSDIEYKAENVSYITKLDKLTLTDESNDFDLCDKDNTYFSLSFFSEGPIKKQYRITLDCSDNNKIITYYYNDVDINKVYTDFIDRNNLESD